MLTRYAFEIPQVVYARIHAEPDFYRPRKLWKKTLAELMALAVLYIFYYSDLKLSWRGQAYMVDIEVKICLQWCFRARCERRERKRCGG